MSPLCHRCLGILCCSLFICGLQQLLLSQPLTLFLALVKFCDGWSWAHSLKCRNTLLGNREIITPNSPTTWGNSQTLCPHVLISVRSSYYCCTLAKAVFIFLPLHITGDHLKYSSVMYHCAATHPTHPLSLSFLCCLFFVCCIQSVIQRWR